MKNHSHNIPFLKTKIGLTLLMLVAVFLLIGLFGFLDKLTTSNKNKQAEQAKLEFYESEKAKIESRLAEVSSEEGIDKTVRENYNLAKEGEGLVIILEEEDTEADASKNNSGGLMDFIRRLFRKRE